MEIFKALANTKVNFVFTTEIWVFMSFFFPRLQHSSASKLGIFHHLSVCRQNTYHSAFYLLIRSLWYAYLEGKVDNQHLLVSQAKAALALQSASNGKIVSWLVTVDCCVGKLSRNWRCICPQISKSPSSTIWGSFLWSWSSNLQVLVSEVNPIHILTTMEAALSAATTMTTMTTTRMASTQTTTTLISSTCLSYTTGAAITNFLFLFWRARFIIRYLSSSSISWRTSATSNTSKTHWTRAYFWYHTTIFTWSGTDTCLHIHVCTHIHYACKHTHTSQPSYPWFARPHTHIHSHSYACR